MEVQRRIFNKKKRLLLVFIGWVLKKDEWRVLGEDVDGTLLSLDLIYYGLSDHRGFSPMRIPLGLHIGFWWTPLIIEGSALWTVGIETPTLHVHLWDIHAGASFPGTYFSSMGDHWWFVWFLNNTEFKLAWMCQERHQRLNSYKITFL